MTNKDAVKATIQSFHDDTGKFPQRLYLGRKTYAELVKPSKAESGMRPTYEGIDVVKVDEENFIGAGL